LRFEIWHLQSPPSASAGGGSLSLITPNGRIYLNLPQLGRPKVGFAWTQPDSARLTFTGTKAMLLGKGHRRSFSSHRRAFQYFSFLLSQFLLLPFGYVKDPPDGPPPSVRPGA
jgi:hypothetical protein